MKAVIVALGSNLGDSRGHLRAAALRLRQRAASGFHASSVWRSTPVDCPPGSPAFLNAVVLFDPRPDETPEALLAAMQAWERDAGRTRRPRNAPRELDLDLVAYGDLVRDTPDLILPHPRAHLRRFVLAPLAEIAPDLRPPGWDASVRERLARLGSEERVDLVGPLIPDRAPGEAA